MMNKGQSTIGTILLIVIILTALLLIKGFDKIGADNKVKPMTLPKNTTLKMCYESNQLIPPCNPTRSCCK